MRSGTCAESVRCSLARHDSLISRYVEWLELYVESTTWSMFNLLVGLLSPRHIHILNIGDRIYNKWNDENTEGNTCGNTHGLSMWLRSIIRSVVARQVCLPLPLPRDRHWQLNGLPCGVYLLVAVFVLKVKRVWQQQVSVFEERSLQNMDNLWFDDVSMLLTTWHFTLSRPTPHTSSHQSEPLPPFDCDVNYGWPLLLRNNGMYRAYVDEVP